MNTIRDAIHDDEEAPKLKDMSINEKKKPTNRNRVAFSGNIPRPQSLHDQNISTQHDSWVNTWIYSEGSNTVTPPILIGNRRDEGSTATTVSDGQSGQVYNITSSKGKLRTETDNLEPEEPKYFAALLTKKLEKLRQELEFENCDAIYTSRDTGHEDVLDPELSVIRIDENKQEKSAANMPRRQSLCHKATEEFTKKTEDSAQNQNRGENLSSTLQDNDVFTQHDSWVNIWMYSPKYSNQAHTSPVHRYNHSTFEDSAAKSDSDHNMSPESHYLESEDPKDFAQLLVKKLEQVQQEREYEAFKEFLKSGYLPKNKIWTQEDTEQILDDHISRMFDSEDSSRNSSSSTSRISRRKITSEDRGYRQVSFVKSNKEKLKTQCVTSTNECSALTNTSRKILKPRFSGNTATVPRGNSLPPFKDSLMNNFSSFVSTIASPVFAIFKENKPESNENVSNCNKSEK